MEAYEATRKVYSRLQAIDPDHASKVMGYLLLHDEGDQELFRLAFSHDAVLQSVVMKVKKELGLTSSRNSYSMPAAVGQHVASHFLPAPPSPAPISSLRLGNEHYNNSSSFLSEQDDRPPLHHSDLPFFNDPGMRAPLRFNNRFGNQDVQISSMDQFPDHLRGDTQLTDQLSFLNEAPDSPYFSPNYLQPDPFSLINGKLCSDSLQPRINHLRRFSTSDLPLSPDSFGSAGAAWKPCVYFARGFCKHGSNCKFLHTHTRSDSGFLLSPSNGQHDSGSDDGISAGTLERLESELHELLRGRRAPISIASLPQLYYERFGKTLQADGYLTESQRHGKAGYSLTKLLGRLKNSVTLIDRPHGQHAVVLAEDAVKFNGCRAEKEDMNPGSRQIYLTFPADSAFTEEDVSAYFRVYGPVQDVRIPFQQKRMFGFVTFVYPETVNMILAKGNPHYICSARVLVKPYKEKGKHVDRSKFPERDYFRFMAGQASENRAFDSISGPRFFMEHDALLRKQLEEQEMMVEMERKRFAELQLQSQRRQQHLQMQREQASALSEGEIYTGPPSAPEVGNEIYITTEGGNEPSDAVGVLKVMESARAFDARVDASDSNAEEERIEADDKEGSIKQSDEHNLPDSPFTSPHKPFSPPPLELPTTKSLALGPLSGPPGFSIPSPSAASPKCRICKDFFNDPVQLDCGHAFCVQCILKVIRVSKEECPICQRHMGSQIVKLMEARRLQVADIW